MGLLPSVHAHVQPVDSLWMSVHLPRSSLTHTDLLCWYLLVCQLILTKLSQGSSRLLSTSVTDMEGSHSSFHSQARVC